MPAELSIRDGLDADLMQLCDLVLNGLVLDGLELVAGALASIVVGALGEESGGSCARGERR